MRQFPDFLWMPLVLMRRSGAVRGHLINSQSIVSRVPTHSRPTADRDVDRVSIKVLMECQLSISIEYQLNADRVYRLTLDGRRLT